METKTLEDTLVEYLNELLESTIFDGIHCTFETESSGFRVTFINEDMEKTSIYIDTEKDLVKVKSLLDSFQ